jgi:hypothetical protein
MFLGGLYPPKNIRADSPVSGRAAAGKTPKINKNFSIFMLFSRPVSLDI